MENINRILLPVDGSETALHAVGHVIATLKACGMPQHEVHLLNVQLPLTGGFMTHDTVEHYQRGEAEKALAPAIKLLQAAGVQHLTHIAVGQIAEAIAHYVKEHRCGQVVMGSRGMGAITGLIIGSVASKVIHLVDVPVTLVK